MSAAAHADKEKREDAFRISKMEADMKAANLEAQRAHELALKKLEQERQLIPAEANRFSG